MDTNNSLNPTGLTNGSNSIRRYITINNDDVTPEPNAEQPHSSASLFRGSADFGLNPRPSRINNIRTPDTNSNSEMAGGSSAMPIQSIRVNSIQRTTIGDAQPTHSLGDVVNLFMANAGNDSGGMRNSINLIAEIMRVSNPREVPVSRLYNAIERAFDLAGEGNIKKIRDSIGSAIGDTGRLLEVGARGVSRNILETELLTLRHLFNFAQNRLDQLNQSDAGQFGLNMTPVIAIPIFNYYEEVFGLQDLQIEDYEDCEDDEDDEMQYLVPNRNDDV